MVFFHSSSHREIVKMQQIPFINSPTTIVAMLHSFLQELLHSLFLSFQMNTFTPILLGFFRYVHLHFSHSTPYHHASFASSNESIFVFNNSIAYFMTWRNVLYMVWMGKKFGSQNPHHRIPFEGSFFYENLCCNWIVDRTYSHSHVIH